MAEFGLVFAAGLVTAIATGLGALPFFIVDDVSDRWNVALWGVASGIMVAVSLFGLIGEGLQYGTVQQMGLGVLAGVVLVIAADRVLSVVDVGGVGEPEAEDQAAALVEADLRKLVLILGILTVHSFPEGVAVGVSFAELEFEGGARLFGFTVPVLAIFMTVGISIHNVPEGLAISIPLRSMNVSKRRMVGAAVFSSLPQPIGAVVAFAFVQWARSFMAVGFGFAAGAMIYLVLTEFIPEALEIGHDLPTKGYRELMSGVVAGVAAMTPLAFL